MHKLFWTKLCASQMCNSWTRTWLPVTTRWNAATKPKEFTMLSYCHESGCHSLQLHITHGLHLHHALHSQIPIHHYTNHTAVTIHSLALIVSPHLHLIHTHTHLSSTLTCTHRKVLFLPRLTSLSVYHSLWLLLLCLTPDCLTLELWTCACDLDPCLVLFTSLLCLWYSCYCLLTIACLILPLSNKYYCTPHAFDQSLHL